MLVVFNAGGELITLTPSQVNQGSNKANTIYIVAPLAPTNVLQARFELPNGKFTKSVITPLAPETGYLGFTDQNGNQLYMWQYDIPSALTTYAGTVTAQFTATNEEQTIATFSFEFEVVAGVPPIAVEDIDSYQSIIEALQSINISVISNGNNLQGQINELKETVTTHTNEVNDLETEKQDKEDLDLATRNKTVVGAINELKNELENLPSGGGETPDLSEYVKFTDYATSQKAGVVKVSTSYGIGSGNGTLTIQQASIDEVLAQQSGYKPITPARSSLSVKTALVTPRTDVEWTDEDKTAACETIGAVKEIESTRSAGQPHLYAQSKDGTLLFPASTSDSGGNTIPIRLPGGQVRVSDPVNDQDATPKKYVDDKIALLNNALEQSEILTVDEIKGVLGSQIIAGGADVLNGSDVTLLTVAGQTVFPSQTSQYDCVFSGIQVTDGTTTNEFIFPTIELPFGKNIDFVNKQKVTTHKFLQFTGSENWVLDRTSSAGFSFFKLELSDMKVGTMQTGKSSKYNVYEQRLGQTDPAQQFANTIMFGNNDNCVYLATPSTTVAEVQAETSGTIIAYPLATEIVTAFTSAESSAGNTYTAIAGGTETMTSSAGQTAPATVTAEYVIVNKVGS